MNNTHCILLLEGFTLIHSLYSNTCITGLIIHPPQDVTICARDDVNITCGHNYTASLTPLWRINGQAISGSKIGTNNTFEMTVVADNIDTVLTVYSANEIVNQTRFQCEFTFLPPGQSSVGILTVMGKLVTEYNSTSNDFSFYYVVVHMPGLKSL